MAQEEGAEVAEARADRVAYSFFRRPEKYKIGEDFDLFVKKTCLYFEAVELDNPKNAGWRCYLT